MSAPTFTILPDDVAAAHRGLQMGRKSVDELNILIHRHSLSDLFTSAVIVEAAKQELARRGRVPA